MLLNQVLDWVACEVSFVQDFLHLLLTIDLLDEQAAQFDHMFCLRCDDGLENGELLGEILKNLMIK